MNLNFKPKENIAKSDLLFVMRLNKIIIKFKELQTIYKMVVNWYDILFFRFGFKKKITIYFREGHKISFTSLSEYFRYFDDIQKKPIGMKEIYLHIDRNPKIVSIIYNTVKLKFHYGIVSSLSNIIWMLREQFLNEQYKWLGVKNKVVIDIGTNVGDTAIYFALKGAKHVYALEPYPYSYMYAIKNIKTNHLEKKITLLNAGCGARDSKITIGSHYMNTASSELKESRSGKKIKLYTLKSISNNYKIDDGAILKIDCEGCEYGVLLSASSKTLRKFKQIQGEYHYGYKNIEKKLKDAGFNVRHTVPTRDTSHEKEGFTGSLFAYL